MALHAHTYVKLRASYTLYFIAFSQ